MDPITEPASGRQGFAEPIPNEQNDNNEEEIQQTQIKRKNYHKNK